MDNFDVVIIGSGLGGLFTGALLAKNGKKVCVLEKNPIIGGNLQVFKRKGCTFSIGMHYAGSLDKGQVLYKIFRYLGIYKDLDIQKLDEECFDKIYIKDREYCFAMGLENFTQKLISDFPGEKEAIETYAEKLKEVWDSSDLINLRSMAPSMLPELKTFKENAWEYLQSLTQNKELRNVLAATNPLYVGHREKTSMFVHSNINYFFIQSAWRIAEQGANIADLLQNIITEAGGSVLAGQEVTKLNFDGPEITSATTAKGDLFYGDQFISDIHPVPLFKMIEPGKFRKAYMNRISDLENTMASFTMYVVLKKKTIKHINANVYYYNTDDVWDYEYTHETWPKGYMLYTTEDINNKGYAESVEVITMMNYNDVKKWENTTVQKRGADYVAFKKEHEKKLLQLIYKKFPEMESAIDYIESATPLTYRDYHNMPEGSLYGIIKDCNNPLETIISPRTRVPNLLLTGQNINLHGILGVIISGFQTCASIIDINKVLKKVREQE